MSQGGGGPISAHICLPRNIKGKQGGPASEHPKLDTMKVPVLPAVVLLSLLALHSAQGAALGSSEVSTSPGLSFSDPLLPHLDFLDFLTFYLLLDTWFLFLNIIRSCLRSWGSGEGKRGGGEQASVGRPVGLEMLMFLEGMAKCWVEAGQLNPRRRRG